MTAPDALREPLEAAQQYEVTVTFAVTGERLERTVGESLGDPCCVCVRVHRVPVAESGPSA
ncbi:MAG: hypothetical protein AB7V27_16805 [Candidatus Binatia bacterium]